MKRVFSLILALAVLLAAGAALAETDSLEVLSCPQAGFSTKIPTGATWTYGDDAVMVWLNGEGYVPHIWIHPRGSKLSDPVGFMHETYPEYMEQQLGDNLRSVNRYEYYEIAGMQLNAVGFIYESSQGSIINELNLVLPLDSQDVEFELRYPNSDRETALAALETVIRYFQPDADYYSKPQASSGTAPQTSSGSAPAEAGSPEEILSCPQAGFSTKIPAGATWEHDDGDVYVWLKAQNSTPNVWIYPRGSKINDPVSYLHVTRVEWMKNKYGDNLRSTSMMEYYEIAGLKLTAVSFIYRSPNGYNINQMNLVLPLDTQDVEFQVRYLNDDRDMALAALETAVRYFQPDADYYSKPQASSGTAPQTSSGAAATAHSFTVTNVAQDGMIIGRCVAPAGYTVASDAFCCTTAQSAGNPWLLTISAMSEDGIMMIYSSGRDYYTRPVDGNTYDEQFNANFMTPMLHYMNAAEFCDYWARKLFQDAKIQLVEENTYPEQQAMLRQKEEAEKKKYDSQTGGIGLTISKIEYSLGARRYYVETSGGMQYYLVIATATQGYWNELYAPGPITDISETYILWGSPYVYVMSCPAYLWEANADVFPVFMENTSVNDQFLLANQKLSTDIWSMLTGIDLVGGTELSRKVMKETTSTGNDYDDERFTDYIYDQNDYTLSDGTHVKISTAYDYVYEGDNGVVYYSDSAFAQPGGSTQLTPNR